MKWSPEASLLLKKTGQALNLKAHLVERVDKKLKLLAHDVEQMETYTPADLECHRLPDGR
jgi:hypothetical protein